MVDRSPKWLIRSCQYLWRFSGFIWGTVVLGLLLNIVSVLLFSGWPGTNAAINGTPISWLLQHPSILIVIGTILLLFTSVVGLGARLDSRPEIRRSYLRRLILETEHIHLGGIPAGLIVDITRLDEVFIPLEFWSNRSWIDYPLTDREIKDLRQSIANDFFSDNLERALIADKKNWQRLARTNNRISIEDIWQQLARESPVAVIQGYPGMGKSTLLARLTLHMARRGLRLIDPNAMRLDPDLIPIRLHLMKYALQLQKKPNLSLVDYLTYELDELNIPGSLTFLREALMTGTCLVMLDGLDEVSDLTLRIKVQEAIKSFVREQHHNHSSKNYNRFLITSRVAGYDSTAFPNYPHYTIAEITYEQINDFLPRWYDAAMRRVFPASNISRVGRKQVSREAEQLAARLINAIMTQQYIRRLAENPLLLILLAVMQLNGIMLPLHQVELYDAVLIIFLESREINKGLPYIPREQAVQYLGSVAFQMQEKRVSFISEHDVITLLAETIGAIHGVPEDEQREEAKQFLIRIRERGGLFVQRTVDYFGFIHRSFQEYFAAHYILNQIKLKQDIWIEKLVYLASNSDDLWREPFLFAVAYASGQDPTIARRIIQIFLSTSDKSKIEEHAHDLLLIIESLVIAKPLSFGFTLEMQIATEILQTYEDAQEIQFTSVCDRIEEGILRWLQSLPEEAYRLGVLTVFCDTLLDMEQRGHQRTVLLLLMMISDRLAPCSPIILKTLIPPILALTGLSAFVDNSDSADLALFLDASLADLAIPLLSLIGSHEPGEIFAGWLSRQGTKALVSYALGIIAQKKGLHEQAQNLHNEGFLVREQVSDPDQRAGILFLEGMIVHSQKLYDEAYSLFEESLSVAQKTMNSKLQASTLYRLGLITQEKGIYREAQRLYEESLALKPNEVEPIIGLNELCFLLREPGNIASIDILERVLSNLKRYINKEDNPNAQRRPEEQKIWQWLYEIIQDINTVQTSRSLLKRTTALNHAVGLLADPLQQTGISQVGKLLIKRVTDRWSTEIARAATRLGKLSVTEYVGSPYMFAPPVTGKALIGRDDIFKRITSLWARPGQRNSLLIYGHRRMGKTSIAQALTSRCNLGDDTKLIYLSLEGQPLQHEGDLYYPLAFRFWQRFKENLDKPEKADFDGDNARVKFDSFLAILNEYIQSGRCVLVLDEFEALYKRLGPLKADETIKYLRAQIVTYAWLALALVGLSDLNDLRLSYNSSLLGWVGIRVGFLDHEQVKMILANPPQAPDFPLDFTPEALEFIAMHTNGQPYLVQVIGDQLVQRYNQMVFVEQREHSGIFNEEDVQEILKDPDFYSTAAAYFDGVWEQATKGQPGEVTLLRVLAKNTDGMDESTLREVADLDETIFMKSLQALIHHDVLCNKNGRVHYTVPLMYRWVQNMCPKE